MSRPNVSVVVPFSGERAEGIALLERLRGIRTRPGDELLVVDNTPLGAFDDVPDEPFRVVPARREGSSYYARNVGASSARNEWLLFIDADCLPSAGLLDGFFGRPLAPSVGAVAGKVVGDETQTGIVPRYLRERRSLDQQAALESPKPHAFTANLLVRAEAWRDVGGFVEGIRSGGDVDFTWRLVSAGWSLEHRAEAWVRHAHVETVRGMARKVMRYGASHAWLERRHPGSPPRLATGREAVHAALAAVVNLARLAPGRAAFNALDCLSHLALRAGTLASNQAKPFEGGTTESNTSTTSAASDSRL